MTEDQVDCATLLALLREIAKVKRYTTRNRPYGRGTTTSTLNVPNELLERIDAAIAADRS